MTIQRIEEVIKEFYETVETNWKKNEEYDELAKIILLSFEDLKSNLSDEIPNETLKTIIDNTIDLIEDNWKKCEDYEELPRIINISIEYMKKELNKFTE